MPVNLEATRVQIRLLPQSWLPNAETIEGYRNRETLSRGAKNISNKNLISHKLAVDIISLKALQNIRFFIYQ